MKKIIYFTLIAFFIMTGSSFAWTVDSTGATDLSNGSIDAKASKNVVIEVLSGGQSYAASAGHFSGDKAYGVASNSSLVMYTTKAKGKAWGAATAPGASDSSAFDDWSSM